MSFYRGSVQFQSRAPSMSNESGVTSMHDDEEEGDEMMVTVSMPASRAREFLNLDGMFVDWQNESTGLM